MNLSSTTRADDDLAAARSEIGWLKQELRQVSERLEQTTNDLERLKESYRDLYHNAPVMFFSLDPRGHFATFNETLLRVLGYERPDLLKQPYSRLLSPEAAAAWEKECTPAAEAGSRAPSHPLFREGEVEMQWVRKDGKVIDVWIRSVPIKEADGRFVRSRAAALNMTERNRLAKELRSRGDQLERANAELRLTNSELEEFTSVVSHDLKEPLRTLQAFSNLMAEEFSGQLGPDGFQYITHMVHASRRLGSLIDDLLNLSQAGRLTNAREAVDLAEIVATVRRDLADLIVRREATLHVEGALPVVAGDPQRMTQLLANLVANALKYNRSAKPLVVIGQLAEAEAAAKARGREGMATLFVRDNGIGIDPRYHQQIFKIFRRLHGAAEYEGTGAGLAICKKIVEGHAGRIWVESEPGMGATFFCTLPLLTAVVAGMERNNGAAQAEPPSPAKNSTPRTPEPRKRDGSSGDHRPLGASPPAPHLLLVEDLPEIGLIARKLAQRAGYRLDWVTSAEEAWDFLQEARPDLLLLDVHLPGMSGLELCRRLRDTPAGQKQVIALFTQMVRPEDRQRGLEAGANFLLSKDLLCQPEAWHRQLQAILERGKAAAAQRLAVG